MLHVKLTLVNGVITDPICWFCKRYFPLNISEIFSKQVYSSKYIQKREKKMSEVK